MAVKNKDKGATVSAPSRTITADEVRIDNGVFVYNLGSGKGSSVKEIVTTFEQVNNLKLNYKFGDRRAGDLPYVVALATKASNELNWKTEKTLEDMCRDSYNFAIKNK